MKNEELTALWRDFVPVASDMAAALLPCSVAANHRTANERIRAKQGHLRLTSDIRGDGLQRVLLQLLHSASNEHMATLALMKVGPDMRVTETEIGSSVGQIGSWSELEATLARYVPKSKYVAGYLFVAAEERESALMETADAHVTANRARYRLETDFLPAGTTVRLAVASSGPTQSLDHPVVLFACGAPGSIELPKPSAELRQRFAWFLDTVPSDQ